MQYIMIFDRLSKFRAPLFHCNAFWYSQTCINSTISLWGMCSNGEI